VVDVVAFDYDIRTKLGPFLLFLCGGLVLAVGTDYPLDTSGLVFVLLTDMVFGLVAIELATSSALRRRLPRSLLGHIRLLGGVGALTVAIGWLFGELTFVPPWRHFVAWLVAWVLMYVALAWATRRARVSDANAN
jgi:hypothetical protein